MNLIQTMEEKGYRIRKVGCLMNGAWVPRPDIYSVSYAGLHLFTVPKKMYPHEHPKYKSLEGIVFPSLYEREHRFKSLDYSLRTTPVLRERDRKERELIALEKNL